MISKNCFEEISRSFQSKEAQVQLSGVSKLEGDSVPGATPTSD